MESELLDLAKALVLVLNRCEAEYALAGGIAVGVHGYLRATEDIDVVLRGRDLAAVDASLKHLGAIVNREPIEFDDGFVLHRRLLPWSKGEQIYMLDLLVPPDESMLARRELSELDGVACWVVHRDDLIAMKRSAGRPQDLLDLEHLEGRE